jgi:SAM-dependent methyltransferase
LRDARHTSLHGLNGDRRLSITGKIAYFVFNRLNNAMPYTALDRRLEIRDFHPPDLGAYSSSLPRGNSPSRTLSDLFWITLPWEALRRELGEIRVLDIGCGSGQYGPQLLDWSGGRIASYMGADVQTQPTWAALERQDSRLRFVRLDASNPGEVAATARGCTFVMSQSALEHIEGDLQLFRELAAEAANQSGPSVHVHLCPSAACLKLYLLHGVRQYTPRTLSKISKLFIDSSVVVYRLGGRASNALHFEFITMPLMIRRSDDLRLTRPAKYEQRLHEAIRLDMASPQPSPAFYALVIQTHLGSRVF